MQEFFFTIVSIWVIWKLFDAFSSPRRSGTSYQQTTNNFYGEKKSEGQVRVESKAKPGPKIPADEGEYVDYEELKD